MARSTDRQVGRRDTRVEESVVDLDCAPSIAVQARGTEELSSFTAVLLVWMSWSADPARSPCKEPR